MTLPDLVTDQASAFTALERSDFYINRELSWLGFNARVLAQGRDTRHPLLERVKFLAIVGTNLDEFFMIRVAALQKQVRTHLETVSADGMTTQQQLTTVREQALAMLAEQGRCWEQELRPELAGHGITFLDAKDYSDDRVGVPRRVFSSRDRPSPDAARLRSRSSLPAHLKPEQESSS